MGSSCEAPHVAILVSPGMGHLIPAAELAKRLVLHHHLTATLITYSSLSSPSQHSLLSSLPAAVSSIIIPFIPLDDLPSSARVETRIAALVARSVPQVTATLRTLNSTTPLTAFIIDLFCMDTLSAAAELPIPRFLFFTTNFMCLSVMLHLPYLDAATEVEYRDLPEPLRLPGCVPVNGNDLFEPMQDKKDDAYRCLVHMADKFRDVDGILVNSFRELEPATAEVLTSGLPEAYPVGPLIQAGGDGGSECLEWLDKQPRGSVLFVSFGSGGTLSTLQMAELAAGLEMSGQRFLWVVRNPNDREASGAFFGDGDGEANVLSCLPEGFLERTRDMGMVVAMWAPQVEVLGHAGTGGFMSHCGWNSTLESVLAGVPMIAWPLYAEQPTNAVLLAEGLGLALKVAGVRDGVVEREQIARVVRELMVGEEGEKVRKRVEKIQVAAAEAVRVGGSSYKTLDGVVTKWMGSYKVLNGVKREM